MRSYATFNDHGPRKSKFVEDTFDNIAERYEFLNGVLSMGIYRYWYSRMLKESSCPEGGSVIDYCTGTGSMLFSFIKKFKLRSAVGIDVSQKMLDLARQKAKKIKGGRVCEFFRKPAENTNVRGEFDCATMAFALRNVSDVDASLKEMRRVLKNGGRVLILELTYPQNVIIKRLHAIYLKYFIPFTGGLLTGKKEAYRYLSESILNFPDNDVIMGMMKTAGFNEVESIRLTCGSATIYKGYK